MAETAENRVLKLLASRKTLVMATATGLRKSSTEAWPREWRQWPGPIEEVRLGDVVWFPPGLKHWHGATPTTAMTHIAVQEWLNGKAVDWLEKVHQSFRSNLSLYFTWWDQLMDTEHPEYGQTFRALDGQKSQAAARSQASPPIMG